MIFCSISRDVLRLPTPYHFDDLQAISLYEHIWVCFSNCNRSSIQEIVKISLMTKLYFTNTGFKYKYRVRAC